MSNQTSTINGFNTESLDVSDLFREIDSVIESRIRSGFFEATPESLGLDPRCASRIWFDEEWIVVRRSDFRFLNYYGGFEYIGQEFVQNVGSYVFYSAGHDRVGDCLKAAFRQLNC